MDDHIYQKKGQRLARQLHLMGKHMEDPFDELLNFEEQYYDEGYKQGYDDGLKQSKLEAKLFGIEKGYEKFVVMGKLQARARVWASRLATAQSTPSVVTASTPSTGRISSTPLAHIARIEKHITVLLALIDSRTLSLANTDDAVADFDDRLKRAQAKEKIIEKILGEDATPGQGPHAAVQGANMNATDMESFSRSLK